MNGSSFAGLEEARLEVAYYNAERRHSSPDYQSPNHFETYFQSMSQLSPVYLDHLK
ncbi:hypothetical protein JAO77_22985 [Hymenobacter sp. BT559]|nr:hypothetical protein [Hymenobacter sp. BT559]